MFVCVGKVKDRQKPSIHSLEVLPHSVLAGEAELAVALLVSFSFLRASLSWVRPRLARGFKAREERLRADRGEGEEEEGDNGEGGDVGERPLDTGRGSVAEELTCCFRRRRWCLKVEDSSRASAERLVVADRLASRALAWLEEESAPSWGYLRRPSGSRPEKLAARVL